MGKWAMRRRLDWMKPADDKILEYLSDDGPNLPTNMAEPIGLTRKYIGQRARELAKYGFVENRGGGLYAITNTGQKYLDGELEASDMFGDESDDS